MAGGPFWGLSSFLPPAVGSLTLNKPGTELEKPGLMERGFFFPPSFLPFLFIFKQEINKSRPEMTREQGRR